MPPSSNQAVTKDEQWNSVNTSFTLMFTNIVFDCLASFISDSLLMSTWKRKQTNKHNLLQPGSVKANTCSSKTHQAAHFASRGSIANLEECTVCSLPHTLANVVMIDRGEIICYSHTDSMANFLLSAMAVICCTTQQSAPPFLFLINQRHHSHAHFFSLGSQDWSSWIH